MPQRRALARATRRALNRSAVFDAPPVDRAPVPALEVRGETLCPRREQVAAALVRMLNPASSDVAGDVAELSDDGDALVVTLRRPSGEIVGEKRVPATLACTVRAEVAAVSIAAFEAQLGGLEVAPPPAPPPPPVPAAPPVAVVVAPPPPAAASVAPLNVELGAAALVSLDGTDAAPAARLEVSVRRGASPWALAIAAAGVGTHRIGVMPGEGTWRRLGAELVLVRTVKPGESSPLELRAGVALAVVDIHGAGYQRNFGDALLDPGAVVGLRVVPLAWRVRPWLDIGGAYWPRAHEVSVDRPPPADPARATLPRGELFVGMGASFGGLR